ncbi:MAG: CoxG family protein [Pseudomonadales bacterium]|jgi:carbon monoxide dehydrogenase subunit G
MELTQTVFIPVGPQLVWEALNDPEILKAALPGCEHFAEIAEHTYEMSVTTRIGPVKATFKGQIHLSDLDPPHRYTIVGEGKGGVAGFAKGQASVALSEAEEDGILGTALSYDVTATVGGKIAQLGGRLIQGAANKLAGEFFEQFSASLQAS